MGLLDDIQESGLLNRDESTLNGLTNKFWKDIPSWARYFTQQKLNATPSQKMQYLEGWQPDISSPNYNVPLAVLQGYSGEMPESWQKLPAQGINWEDSGPAGARWHGSDRTPAGEWLKAPWSSEKEYGYIQELMKEEAIRRLISGSE